MERTLERIDAPSHAAAGGSTLSAEERSLRRARSLLEGARRVLVLTGAGVSADSGVPTFRGEEGLWRDRRPEELATPEAFARDPRLVWEWYAWRRRTVAGCEPNAAHLALARATARSPGWWIATQNVDDLHRRALRRVEPGSGPSPAAGRLLELHGSLFRTRCTGCGRRREHRAEIDASSREGLPRCGACGELLRPDVVWFGEALDSGVLGAATGAARAAEACLVVGTSAVVQPAASLAVLAARSGAALVEVNPGSTPLSGRADAAVRRRAADAVPDLVEPGDGG